MTGFQVAFVHSIALLSAKAITPSCSQAYLLRQIEHMFASAPEDDPDEVRQWAEAQRSHGGPMLIWTLDHSQFAEMVAGVKRQLAQRPTQEQWQDITVAS